MSTWIESASHVVLDVNFEYCPWARQEEGSLEDSDGSCCSSRAGAVSGHRPPSPCIEKHHSPLPPIPYPRLLLCSLVDLRGADPTCASPLGRGASTRALIPGELLKRNTCGHGLPAGSGLGRQIRAETPWPDGNPLMHFSSGYPLPSTRSPLYFQHIPGLPAGGQANYAWSGSPAPHIRP